MANSSQLLTNVVVKMTSVKRHLRSTSVVKTSCRNLPCSRMFLCAKLHEPFLAMKRALFTRSLNTGLRGMRDTSPGRPNSSGMMLFLASIFSRCAVETLPFGSRSVRLYARIQHVRLKLPSLVLCRHQCTVCFGVTAARRLCSAHIWDGLHSPVDVVHLPEHRPGL